MVDAFIRCLPLRESRARDLLAMTQSAEGKAVIIRVCARIDKCKDAARFAM